MKITKYEEEKIKSIKNRIAEEYNKHKDTLDWMQILAQKLYFAENSKQTFEDGVCLKCGSEEVATNYVKGYVECMECDNEDHLHSCYINLKSTK